MPENSAVYTSRGKYYEPRDAYRKAPQQSGRVRQKKRKKHPKGWLGKIVRGFFLRLIISLLIVSALTGFAVYRTFWADNASSASKVDYTFGDGDDKLTFTGDAKSSYHAGILYVNFTALSEKLGIARLGNIGSLRFVITDAGGNASSAGSGHEEYAVFTEGSTTAEVNGAFLSMEGESRIIGTDIWIPVSFIENYIGGITVTVSDKGDSVKVVPGDGESEDTVTNITLRLKKSDPITPVAYSG